MKILKKILKYPPLSPEEYENIGWKRGAHEGFNFGVGLSLLANLIGWAILIALK